MKSKLLCLLGLPLMMSPAAPRGCATYSVGVEAQGRYGTYAVTRTVDRNSGAPANWDLRAKFDAKQLIPLQ